VQRQGYVRRQDAVDARPVTANVCSAARIYTTKHGTTAQMNTGTNRTQSRLAVLRVRRFQHRSTRPTIRGDARELCRCDRVSGQLCFVYARTGQREQVARHLAPRQDWIRTSDLTGNNGLLYR
jgi:hypothetical protein